MPIGKSANEAYREYKKRGGTLSFSEFIKREKEKLFSADGLTNGMILINKELNNEVQSSINQALSEGGLKKEVNTSKILGINKTVFFIGSGIVLLSVASILYIKYKNSI